MGLTCITVCIRCKLSGPPIGDFGVLGYPSLDESFGAERIPNFGFIYKGLSAIGLRTWPVECYRAFLEQHQGHQLDVVADGSPIFGAQEVEWTDGGEPPWTEQERHAYPLSYYVLSCSLCSREFSSREGVNIAPFPPFVIPRQAAALYLSNVADQLHTGYRSWPLGDDGLTAIAEYLRHHAKHGPIASTLRHPDA